MTYVSKVLCSWCHIALPLQSASAPIRVLSTAVKLAFDMYVTSLPVTCCLYILLHGEQLNSSASATKHHCILHEQKHDVAQRTLPATAMLMLLSNHGTRIHDAHIRMHSSVKSANPEYVYSV